MRPVRGAVLSPTLIESESMRSRSAVNAAASARRICRNSTNYVKMQTQLCSEKSSPTAVTSSINFYRHFRRLRSITVCAIELISSVYRTAQGVLWIVTF